MAQGRVEIQSLGVVFLTPIAMTIRVLPGDVWPQTLSRQSPSTCPSHVPISLRYIWKCSAGQKHRKVVGHEKKGQKRSKNEHEYGREISHPAAPAKSTTHSSNVTSPRLNSSSTAPRTPNFTNGTCWWKHVSTKTHATTNYWSHTHVVLNVLFKIKCMNIILRSTVQHHDK